MQHAQEYERELREAAARAQAQPPQPEPATDEHGLPDVDVSPAPFPKYPEADSFAYFELNLRTRSAMSGEGFHAVKVDTGCTIASKKYNTLAELHKDLWEKHGYPVKEGCTGWRQLFAHRDTNAEPPLPKPARRSARKRGKTAHF